MKRNVVVIGCGAGGFTSALYLAGMGREVTIVSERIPSTALFSGASYDFVSEEREHIYEALNFFKSVINSSGYPLSISEKKIPLLTESGGIIESQLFTSLSAIVDINFLMNKKVLLLGIKGLRGFIPELILLRIKRFIKSGIAGWNSIMMDFAFSDIITELTSISFATLLDIKEHFEKFKDALLSLKEIQSYDAVLLPPILGIKNYNENYRELKGILNPEVGELLSSIPSVNGIRLLNGMERTLREKNLKIIQARCIGFTGDDRIESIRVVSETGESSEIPGDVFIYAPGRFIGRGISSGKEIREAIFGLPLYYNGRKLNSYFHSLFTYSFSESQPCLHAGIMVNENFQPLTEDGRIFAKNLYSAGSIIARNLRNGIAGAISSGYLCVRAIL